MEVVGVLLGLELRGVAAVLDRLMVMAEMGALVLQRSEAVAVELVEMVVVELLLLRGAAVVAECLMAVLQIVVVVAVVGLEVSEGLALPILGEMEGLVQFLEAPSGFQVVALVTLR